MADVIGAFTTLDTLAASVQGKTQTLNITRKRDGSIEFLDKTGKKVRVHGSPEMTALYESLKALA